MDLAADSKARHMLGLALATLIVLGLALLFSTWHMVRRQQAASEQHMALAATSVLQAVDSTRRSFSRYGSSRFTEEMRDFFQTLEQDADLLMVGVLEPDGKTLRTRPSPFASAFTLPPQAQEALRESGTWHGRLQVGGTLAYVAARRFPPSEKEKRRHMDEAPMRRGRHGHDPGSLLLPPVPPLPPPPLASDMSDHPSLVVALDMDKHVSVYRSLRKAALLQAAYILGAALVIWALAVRLLARRAMASRAVYLERLQARLLDALPDGLLLLDADDRVSAANPAARDLLAPDGKSLVGSPFADLGLDRPSSGLWKQVKRGQSFLEVFSLSATDDKGALSRLVIIRDRTRMRTLEKNLAEAEKLAALGTLAAGVAHEIRNPLSALRGFAQFFARKLAGKQPEEEYARTMVLEADRLNRVITDLLYLSRPRTVSLETVDLAEVTAELGSLLQFELEGAGVRLEVELHAAQIRADRESLKPALLNLLLNALEAIRSLAATESMDTPKRDFVIRIVSDRDESGDHIRVVDNGPGMQAEQAAQAFEPFFTTKGKGTGLGLALVHKTMREHGGDASIDCEPGKGCVVTLTFPLPDDTEQDRP